MKLTLRSLLVLGACGTCLSASAAAFNLRFDSLADGANANIDAPPGLRFDYAVLSPDLDLFGDPILGTDKWRIDLDPLTPPVSVKDHALDAFLQPVLISFNTLFDITGFSTRLDNDSFGFNGTLPGLEDISVQFFGSSGNLLGRIAVDQTTPGFIASGAGFSGVAAILLPGGATYDDISIRTPSVAPVPEVTLPGTIGVGAIALGGLVLRRRRAANVA